MALFLKIVAILLIIFTSYPLTAYADGAIRGVVLDDKGVPVAEADVSVYLDGTAVAQAETDHGGRFEINVAPSDEYLLVIFSDLNGTDGVDYLPIALGEELGVELTVTVGEAASYTVVGDVQFVESEDLPISVLYSVLDPATGKVFEINDLPLFFGSDPRAINELLDLPSSDVIIPAETPVKIGVNCSVLIGQDVVERYFEIDGPGHLSLGAGERATIEISRYHVPMNLEVSQALLKEVAENIDGMEEVGFYLASQRKQASSAQGFLSNADLLFKESMFTESFDEAKKAFIELRNTRGQLDDLYADASLSVYILIVFMVMFSVNMAFMQLDRTISKVFGSLILCTITLAVFYLIYPGSTIIPQASYLQTSVLAVAGTLVFASAIPRFFVGGGDGHMSVRNIVVPIFSIAKRNLRRRRFRFLLTVLSITALVMSFVSLTSFSEGYGLTRVRVSNTKSEVNTILLRARDYSKMEPIYFANSNIDADWLVRQPESAIVSLKAETPPLKRPILSLNGIPLRGVLAFDPVLESQVTNFNGLVIEGRLHTSDGVMISRELRDRLDVKVGDTLTLDGLEVRLDGIIDDESLSGLKELDGSSFLPGKMVNLSPEGDEPFYVYEACSPSEIVIVHLSQVPGAFHGGVTRIAVSIGDDFDADSYADRLALERGYRVYSSTEEGVFLHRLGAYLEGKGLPLIVPWVIVILNMVMTMLSSMYERRKEIQIFSSIGLNPAQIGSIFFAEATILGLTGGGLGYIAGLGFYSGMNLLGLSLAVHQKLSAFWSVASIGIAMTAVLMGTFVALKNSVVITPSHEMRWRIAGKEKRYLEPWEIVIPVRLLPEETDAFIEYVFSSLKELEKENIRRTSAVKMLYGVEGRPTGVTFVYKEAKTAIGNFYTRNTLLVEAQLDQEAMVNLKSTGEQSWAHISGSLIRNITMKWSITRETSGKDRDSQ